MTNNNTVKRVVKSAPVITLTTDFGFVDPYVGVVKGVIYSLCPDAKIVDLTHSIPPQDTTSALLTLESVYSYFPPGTIHIAIVDPGVGSKRHILAVRARGMLFIAPDNGILSFLGEDEIDEMRAVTNPAWKLDRASDTFHGRDIFAPTAAALAKGEDFSKAGPLLDRMFRITLPEPEKVAKGVKGEILSFDHFGNAITNLTAEHVSADGGHVSLAGRHIPIRTTFSDVEESRPVAYIGSTGRMEIAVRNENAQAHLGLARGDAVICFSGEADPEG